MINTTIKTIHLIGLGAVGATYASLLYQMDQKCIKIILDEGRVSHYKQGTLINGTRYNFDLSVPKDGGAKAEFIIIAVKGHQLEEAIKCISPLVGKNTILLSLLNGITSEDNISQAYGQEKVLHGFCVGTDAVREKGEVKFKNAGKIVFGEYFSDVAGKAAPVAELFAKAGISYTIPLDIRREMWWKFMMNVGLNQTSAILKAPYGEYKTISEARDLMASACREVIPLALKEGISLSESDIAEYFDVIGVISPLGKPSMLQDVEAGRKTEVENFALAVMNLGKKHSISTPVNEVLYRMIRILEKRN